MVLNFHIRVLAGGVAFQAREKKKQTNKNTLRSRLHLSKTRFLRKCKHHCSPRWNRRIHPRRQVKHEKFNTRSHRIIHRKRYYYYFVWKRRKKIFSRSFGSADRTRTPFISLPTDRFPIYYYNTSSMSSKGIVKVVRVTFSRCLSPTCIILSRAMRTSVHYNYAARE